MNIAILLLSIILAACQAGVAYVALAFEPVAQAFAAWPVWALTGIIFAAAMLLSFVLIFIVGALGISSHAADFVRDHFGRAIALMLVSVVFISGLSAGCEAVYQLGKIRREKKETVVYSDILFMLDISGSMDSILPGNSGVNRIEALKEAFKRNINEMKDGQNISIVAYETNAEVIQDWVPMNDLKRQEICRLVDNIATTGGTDFDKAFICADNQVKKSISEGRNVEVILITDAEDMNVDVTNYASSIYDNDVKVHGILVGETIRSADLRQFVRSTGGTYFGSQGTVNVLASQIKQITEEATKRVVAKEGFQIRDTLITERDENRERILPGTLMRIVFMLIICFVFKLIVNVCIGNNTSSLGSHVFLSFVFALVSALALEFGYQFGLPMIAVTGILWLLMMNQIVFTDR